MMMHTRKCNCTYNYNVIVVAIIFIAIATQQYVQALPNKDVQPSVKINKCCEKFEIYVDGRCTIAETVNSCKLTKLTGCFMDAFNGNLNEI